MTVLLVFLTVLLQLGLAILGWGVQLSSHRSLSQAILDESLQQAARL